MGSVHRATQAGHLGPQRLDLLAEEAQLEEKAKLQQTLQGNPLLQGGSAAAGGSSKLKRRWDDDVVFRNQARNEPETKRRFINDTIRNDFHRRFLNKFIQ